MSRITGIVLYIYIISIYIFSYRTDLNSISNILGIIFILLTFFKIIKKRKIKINMLIAFIFMFLIVLLSTYFIAINNSLVISKASTIFQIFILVIALVNFLDTKTKIRHALYSFISAGTISSIYILINMNFTEFDRVGGIIGNQNTVGILLSISLIICINFILYEKKIFLIFSAAITFTVILLSGSRTAIMFIIVSSIILFYNYSIYNTKNKCISIIKMIILFSVVILIMYNLVMNVEYFYKIIGIRFESLLKYISEGASLGGEKSIMLRNNMINIGWNMFFERPILGYGIDNYRELLYINTGMYTYSHNNYIELLVGTGILGTIVFYSIFIRALLFKFDDISINNLFKALLLGILLMNISSIIYYSKYIYILLAIIYSCRNIEINNLR